MEEKQLHEITSRLDRLARLVALTGSHGLTMTERIMLFYQAGFRPAEIAETLGTTANVVNVRLSELRKKGVLE